MLYNLFTQWITLSFIFFIVQYYTEWLEVVTLGGLTAGAFIAGALMTAGARLACFLEGRLPEAAARAGLLSAVLFSYGGYLLPAALLPGYAYHPGPAETVFTAAFYPAAAVAMNKFMLFKEKRNGN